MKALRSDVGREKDLLLALARELVECARQSLRRNIEVMHARFATTREGSQEKTQSQACHGADVVALPHFAGSVMHAMANAF